MSLCLLGLTLDEALRRLRAEHVTPEVLFSRAPRRPEGVGAFRVVRVRDGGKELVVCAFLAASEEKINEG